MGDLVEIEYHYAYERVQETSNTLPVTVVTNALNVDVQKDNFQAPSFH